MPAKDTYHDVVRNALINDGWTVTDDPLKLKYGETKLYVDLAAEKFVVAEKAGRKIAVEVKTFAGMSEVDDLEKALGQFFVYLFVLGRQQPDRVLYLAVEEEVFLDVFEKDLGKDLIAEYSVPVIVFDSQREEVVRWID